MRYIVNYIRQIFCNHNFEKSEANCEITGTFDKRVGIKVCLICKKCGYHKSFWKY